MSAIPHDGAKQHTSSREATQPAAVSHRWVESTGPRLLLVDRNVDDDLGHQLSERGVHVTAVGSTLTALIEFGRLEPRAVVVAACAAEGVSACEFVSEVRRRSSPLVIAALDSGNDPVGSGLLLAGAGAAITRPYTAEGLCLVLEQFGRFFDHDRLTSGPIEVDSRTYRVRVRGQQVADLPPKEFEMLRLLLQRAPEVVSNEELRASLWGPGTPTPTDNTIAVHVGRLRQRLSGVAQIRRLRGRGYALVVPSPATGAHSHAP